MSAPHSSSEDCPGHSPLIDLLGNDEPSGLLKAAAEVLGVQDQALLGLVLTYFMAAAIESTDLGIGHMLVDNAVEGLLPVGPVARVVLDHAVEARQTADRAAGIIAMLGLVDSVKARRN